MRYENGGEGWESGVIPRIKEFRTETLHGLGFKNVFVIVSDGMRK